MKKNRDEEDNVVASNLSADKAGAIETENVSDGLKQKIEELENQVKRALADYQNLEIRVMEERRVWVQQANKGMLLRFLPGVDTLELAAKHSKDQGIGLALAQILQALREEGIKKIATEGLVFDPHTMECVETVDGQEGIVEKEIRAGYTLYDKILRPAQVLVGR